MKLAERVLKMFEKDNFKFNQLLVISTVEAWYKEGFDNYKMDYISKAQKIDGGVQFSIDIKSDARNREIGKLKRKLGDLYSVTLENGNKLTIKQK